MATRFGSCGLRKVFTTLAKVILRLQVRWIWRSVLSRANVGCGYVPVMANGILLSSLFSGLLPRRRKRPSGPSSIWERRVSAKTELAKVAVAYFNIVLAAATFPFEP